MANNGGAYSNINLKTFIEILENCASGTQRVLLDKNDKIDRVLLSLKEEGLISFSDEIDDKILTGWNIERLPPIRITPKGAKSIIEFKKFIRENSWWHPALSGVSKAAWVLQGSKGFITSRSTSDRKGLAVFEVSRPLFISSFKVKSFMSPPCGRLNYIVMATDHRRATGGTSSATSPPS